MSRGRGARVASARAVARVAPPVIGPRLVRALLGSGATADPGAPPEAAVMDALGYYEWRSVLIAALLCRPGDRIVEVGAHIGSETMGFARIVGPAGRVDAYEPLDRNAALVEARAAAAGLDQIRVTRAAVSDHSGRGHFAVPEPGQVTLAGHLSRSAAPGHVEVPVVALDDDLGAAGDVRLLAVDAEGADLGVLRGARELLAASEAAVIVEALPPEDDALGRWTLPDLAAELRASGRRIWRIARLGLTPLPGAGELRTDQAGFYNWLALTRRDEPHLRPIHRAIRRGALLPRPALPPPLGRGRP